MSVDLGSILNTQKLVGVTLNPKDANGNIVANFNQPQVTVDQSANVSVGNIAQSADGKTITFDLIGKNPTVDAGGVANSAVITVTGQQGNFQPHYSSTFTLAVTLDPSLPGPPTHFDMVSPGTVEAQ